jgi:formamidopyrimidine-DNA glycosylase
MPELPEVQTIIVDLRKAGIEGSRILDADVLWPRSVGGDAEQFQAGVRGWQITALRRRGKYLRFDGTHSGAKGDHTETASLLVHLRMSGRLYLLDHPAPRTGYERVLLSLEDRGGRRRELHFYDPRKFGRMLFLSDPERRLERLGMEPLEPEFTPEALSQGLQRPRGIKALLLDQTVVAGLGNIYVDEALWQAGVHPERRANTLSDTEIHALHEAIPEVLRRGIANLGTSLGSGKTNFVFPHGDGRARNQEQLRVFQRTGLPCPRCGTAVQRIKVAQRSSHFCPQCQPGDPTTDSVSR